MPQICMSSSVGLTARMRPSEIQRLMRSTFCWVDLTATGQYLPKLRPPPSTSVVKMRDTRTPRPEPSRACADAPVALVNDRQMVSFMSNDKLDELVDGLRAAEGKA